MLRFILKRKVFDAYSTVRYEEPRTLDIDVPKLEYALKRGGYGMEQGFDLTVLDSVEILEDSPQDTKEERATTNNIDSMPF